MIDWNQCTRERFIVLFGQIFEQSPWIAVAAEKKRPYQSAEALFHEMTEIVYSANEARKLALILAHPRLGSKKKMNDVSAGEQRQAGLLRLKDEESAELEILNRAYEKKFGMPFIKAVRGLRKNEILAELNLRLQRSKDQEYDTAIKEIIKIAKFRFDDLLHSGIE
ncbi:2-oxo-4-hydroxy-4-carboxy-5-ureidoimidazoline decarboxylase [Sporolactobacillus spathodeae]|uniref:2-oxo-4-hydroxy-4-carboxy-5-ureidoimidazoline decarboxylase n=1 Tax=Sporolactobacillus spathodeae TaxID=1465502 RepID=A0ABS2Q8V7_9BACL|nr:2-oxo-4-hydroxy-4-carboxy-5-ureidoimidazoline decarboxylase [Sporolactobacillus spathodeae]MBM7658218.1 2-oxo-4-hydroxy-4-carboxy-5-ureidoimidazoline decarboxylase [Sporolactobacillus spathodeae]